MVAGEGNYCVICVCLHVIYYMNINIAFKLITFTRKTRLFGDHFVWFLKNMISLDDIQKLAIEDNTLATDNKRLFST